MLTLPQVRRYSAQSCLRDIMIAEKEIVLTFLFQLLLNERDSGSACLQWVANIHPIKYIHSRCE